MNTLPDYYPQRLPEISIEEIRTDEAGRFRLNDLDRLSGGDSGKRPGDWLRLSQAQELIEHLTQDAILQPPKQPKISIEHRTDEPYPAQIPTGSSNQQVSIVKTGDPETYGTYVTRDLVYAYAMWLSPVFHLQVIRLFDSIKTGNFYPFRQPGKTFCFHNPLFNLNCKNNVKGDLWLSWPQTELIIQPSKKLFEETTSKFGNWIITNDGEYIYSLAALRMAARSNSKHCKLFEEFVMNVVIPSMKDRNINVSTLDMQLTKLVRDTEEDRLRIAVAEAPAEYLTTDQVH